MKKLIIFALKILPLITIYKGLTSGGKKFSPVFDIAKVAFTKYELSLIAKEVINDYKEKNGDLIAPNRLNLLIQDRYYNNYSKYMRMVFNHDSEDFTYDLWDSEYHMDLTNQGTLVVMRSPGPDGELDTRDDIAIDFRVQQQTQYAPNQEIAVHARRTENARVPANDEDDRYWEERDKDSEDYYKDEY